MIRCAMPHLTSHTHTRSEVKRKPKADNLTLLSLEAPSEQQRLLNFATVESTNVSTEMGSGCD